MPLAVELIAHNLSPVMPAGTVRFAHVQVRNAGDEPWHVGGSEPVIALDLSIEGVVLGSAELPVSVVARGATVTFSFGWRAPEHDGRARAELALRRGDGPERVVFVVDLMLSVPPDDRTEARMRGFFAHDPWHWLPSGGVRLSTSGRRYPTLIASASGALVRDEDDREYVDWVMGWGTCLLGYADARITGAAMASLRNTSLTTLPSVTEVEVAELLCARFPGAEMVAFGKNGSDMCTAAVRLARAFTGREIVLHSGYHGWHDWYVDRRGIEGAGVPRREPGLVHDFAPGDLQRLDALLAAHAGRVAAIMLEPAGQIGGIDGPVHDADPTFLRAIAARCRAAGALLIFDEIFTAFRYRGGSVQYAVGVQPDLTCLGKALSNGMPLAAVVGRRDVLSAAMPRVALDATFKGEPHSLAAARAALRIHDALDVPAHVEAIGRRLAAGICAAAERHGVAAKVVGPPIRMTVALGGAEAPLLRTLLQQELLLNGVITFRGFMLPSLAHGEPELLRTLRAFDAAFARVRSVQDHGQLLQSIEIPFVT